MDKVIQNTAPVVGVGYGQQAILNLAVGPRYHAVTFEIIATAASAITLTLADVMGLINVKVNGKVQRAHLATELDKIVSRYHTDFASQAYNYDGNVITYTGTPLIPQAPVAGKQTIFYLTLWFAEPWRKSYAATESMAWYTSWADGSSLRTFQVELNIPAATARILAGSAITINAFAQTDTAVGPLDGNKNPIALITRFERNQYPYGGAGDLIINTLPIRDLYLQISLFSAADGNGHDYINYLKVKVDDRTVRDLSRMRNDVTLVGREWNAGQLDEDMFDIGFDFSDLPTDGLVMQAGSASVRNFQVIPTLASAVCANKIITVLSQVYGGIV